MTQKRMQETQYLGGLLIALGGSNLPASGMEETHAHLQAVNADGTSAWDGTLPFTLTGVILNNPEDMLDPAPDFIERWPAIAARSWYHRTGGGGVLVRIATRRPSNQTPVNWPGRIDGWRCSVTVPA